MWRLIRRGLWRPRSAGLFILVLALAGLSGIFSAYHCCGPGIFCSDPGDPTFTPTAVPTATNTPVPDVKLCPKSYDYHCYAEVKLSTGANEWIDGVFARFPVEPYQTDDGGHSNQTLWLSSVVGQDENQWCEVGWTKGWTDLDTGAWHDGYAPYSGYTEPGAVYGTYVFHEFTLASYGLVPDGTVHSFQIQRNPGTEEGTAFVDYTPLQRATDIFSCDLSAFWEPNVVNAGLEYTDENAVNNGVSPYDLELRPYESDDGAAPWQSWAAAPAIFNCSVVGDAAYIAWLDYKYQFTDSSNVRAGGNAC